MTMKNSNMILSATATNTMTSREIAELTGKEHKNVLRDIDNLLKTLDSNMSRGFSMTYEGDPSNGYRYFVMDRDSTYCLVSGYDANARMRIIKRWQELEANETKPTKVSVSKEERARLMLAREAYKTARLFGFAENMAILSADNYVRRALGDTGVLSYMESTHLVADERGRVYTPTELGKLMTPPLSAVKFNLQLEASGLQKKELGGWLPTDEAQGFFEWADTGKQHSNGTPVKQLRWFKSVLDRLPHNPQHAIA